MNIKIGDALWIPRTGQNKVEKPCPVCFGKLVVTVILGDDSRIETPCDYCGKGFEGPTGIEKVWEREPGAELFIVSTIRTNTTVTGEESEYTTSGGHYSKGDNLYATKEEAIEASKELQKEQLEDDERRASSIKKNVHKSFSWNVGYHMMQAKYHKQQVEYHERMAVLCKQRSKPKKEK